MRAPQKTAVVTESSVGDFMPNGSWNPRSGHRGQLWAFVRDLCAARRSGLAPAAIAHRIQANPIWERAFPNREQWASITISKHPWLAAWCGTSAEVAVKYAGSDIAESGPIDLWATVQQIGRGLTPPGSSR